MHSNKQDSVPGGPYAIILYRVSRALAQRFKALNQTATDGDAFIVSVAPDGPAGLVALCRRLSPSVLVIESPTINDLPYEELKGLTTSGAVRMLLFVPESAPVEYESILEKGFSGIVQMGCGNDLLARSIRAVLAGELWAPRIVLSNLAKEGLARTSTRGLTQREVAIHELVCQGLTNQQIADRLFISRETVRWHLRSLYTKLGVANQRSALQDIGRSVREGS